MAAQKSNYWQQLQEADGRIRASHVIWKRIRTKNPNSKTDPEKAAAKVMGIWRQEGRSEMEIQSIGRAVLQSTKNDSLGSTQTATLTIVHGNGATRADVIEGPPITPGVQRSGTAYFIDFYDGKHSVTMDGMGSREPKSGSLQRATKPEQALGHAASGFADPIFLFGAPVTERFSATDSVLREGRDDTIILEKRVQKPYPALLRMTVSKRTWRPLVFEDINQSDNRTLTRCEANGYQLYQNGVWFPTSVLTKYGHGSLKHDLQKAVFNEAVDLTALNLPAKSTIDDYRFTNRPPVRYKITTRLPTDAEVLKLVQRREAEQAAEQQQQQKETAKFTLLPLGFVLLAVGVWLWRRSSRAAKA